MTVYEQNVFDGGQIRLDGCAWRGNLIKNLEILVNTPPVEFPNNRVVNCTLSLGGQVGATLKFIRELAASNPELRQMLRSLLGLDEVNESDGKKH